MKNIVISSKNIEMSSDFIEYINLEVKKNILSLVSEDVKVKIFIQYQNYDNYKVDISVRIENIKINTSNTYYDIEKCIDACISDTSKKIKKINKKIKRHEIAKENKQCSRFCNDIFVVKKMESMLNINEDLLDMSNDCNFKFVKSKKLDLKPMSYVEAVLQMNLIGHNFFLFLDESSLEKTIVYKREDGKYGIIS